MKDDEDYKDYKDCKDYKEDNQYIPPKKEYTHTMPRPYESLIAWQESYKLCLWIYQLTKPFPSDERFGLISQMRRAAISVPLNIAEGNTRRCAKDSAHFFEIALASLEELHCQCRIALGLTYIQQQEFEIADAHVHRVSYLINKLRSAILK